LNKAYFVIPIFLLLFIQIAYSSSSVVVEFLYYDPSTDPNYCGSCPTWIEAHEDFLTKKRMMNRIEMDYGSRVTINWTQCDSPDGQAERHKYFIPECNSLIIKSDEGNVTVIQSMDVQSRLTYGTNFNETYIRAVIDAYLQGTPQPSPASPEPLMAVLVVAFSFGFFETFSPCLMVLLSFVLSYSLDKATRFRDGMFQVGCFGIGFVGAALSLGLTVAALSLGIGQFYRASTLIVCVFAILFGLYQMNLFKRTLVETKPIIKTLANKYACVIKGSMAKKMGAMQGSRK